MSTRKLTNLFRRRFFLGKFNSLIHLREEKWFEDQLKDLSRLGGSLVVMKMGD